MTQSIINLANERGEHICSDNRTFYRHCNIGYERALNEVLNLINDGFDTKYIESKIKEILNNYD